MFFKNVECLASTYKNRGLNCKLPKTTRYIYIYMYIYIYIYKREFFVLIISLNTSYGYNIFTKILQ